MTTIKKFYYDFITFIFETIARLSGPIHARWTKKKITDEDVMEIEDVIQPADVIVTRTRGELTTLLIPGYWKHAVMYVGDDVCIDSTAEGVLPRFLEGVLYRTDYVAILRPRVNTQYDRFAMITYAKEQVGKEYDYRNNFNNDSKFGCSELVWSAYKAAILALPLIKRMGVETFTPTDIYESNGFELVYEVKE